MQLFRLFLAVILASLAVSRAPGASILREVWHDIPGNAVSELTNDPRYPNNPSESNHVTDFFEAPIDVMEAYGQRMHGYIIPPVTGDYTFWIATDDGGELWLSTDETPGNQRRIAWVNGWTPPRNWEVEGNQRSAPIRLEAEKAYYIAALQKEGGGGDNLAVRWLRPDGVDQGPIPATFLYPWGTAFTPPRITAQPKNATVVEGGTAEFAVGVDPLSPASAQWRKGGANLSSATSLTLQYGPVTIQDNQSRFMVVLTNRLGSTNSAEAVLTVTPDQTPPTLVSALNLGAQTSVRVIYSEPVEASSATNPNNYTFNNGVTVTSAAMGPDNRTVILTTTAVAYGTAYTISVNRVRDQAATPNTIVANSPISFVAVEYAPVDIGTALSGSTVPAEGGFNITGSGRDIGGTTDQFHFGYQERTGDFDIQVRLADLQITDAWVQAGLVARQTLSGNSQFAGIFSSSAELGAFFESRATAGAASATTAPPDGFPVNYPEMYLRLRRAGNVFTGFAGFDGTNWQQLGTVTITMPSKVFLGMAVSSHNTALLSTAKFRDLKPASSPGSFTYTRTLEPLGPSNRRTGLTFSEIMYNPARRDDSKDLEFIEIYNAESVFVDLEGWRLAGAVEYVFPAGTRIYPGQFLVVAAAPPDMQSVYGVSAMGPYAGRLNNSGDTLFLHNDAGAVRLEVEYGNRFPWPASADGTGHSLILAKPSYGEDDPRAWKASERVGGSPAQVDPVAGNRWSGVVINEFLAHTDDPILDFVELYNASNSQVDISGCYLTDDPSTNKFQIPANTILGPRAFISFDQSQLGFALSSAGETVYLLAADQSRVLDAVRFEGQENGVSTGRVPDGSPTFRRLISPTPAAANTSWRVEPVVINEVMYHPISNDDDEQYVELHNRGAAAIDVGGWRFTSGIDFELPVGASIPAGGYIVVARDSAKLRANYPQLNAQNTFGDFGGRVSRGGERLVLSKMDIVQETNEFGINVEKSIYIEVSEVSYTDGGRWPDLADGGGSSLELIDPRADTLRPSNWAASDERSKAPWTTVEMTATMDNGQGTAANRFLITHLGGGEALVDDLEIFRTGSANLLSNPGFENGRTGWTFAGNHSGSGIDTTGAFSGSSVLRVSSPGDGDTWNNAIRANLSTTLASGNVVTLRAKVRWLSGWPELLFRVRGNAVEFPARMSIPKNLGTPGQANSTRVSNAGPAIFDVTHSPALPRANQAVIVTARVSDPDGVAAPRLRYRIDPASTVTTTQMRDDGLQGDALAGDGVWSASINGRASGTLIAFRVEASDDAASSASSVFPKDAPAREALIRWGDAIPWGTFEHHHLWNTAATESAFNSGGGLNNSWRDATIVYGTSRVIYNASFRHKGSPYHGGTGDIAATVPKDELLLGTDDRVYGSTGNGGAEDTQMRGDLANWIAEEMGIPFLHSHYIRMYRNGGQFQNILYDLEQPNRSMAESWFGGGEVNDALYKIAVWFEFQDGGGFDAVGASLERFLSGGNLDLGRYRWNWQIRPDGTTANDYTGIFNLVNAMANASDRVTRLPLLADVEQWMRVLAWNRLNGNWDSYGMGYGQNMYLYSPLGQRAKLMPWDVDFVLGLGNGPSEGLWGGSDPRINELYDIPVYRRMLWRAYQDAVNGPLLAAQYQPQIDARRAALVKNGVGASDPGSIRTFIEARRNFIRNQIQSADNPTFAITSNNGNDFTSASGTVQISGSAPFAVATIEVNGIPYPVSWTGFNTWRIDVPLGAATNVLSFTGRDLRGNIIPGMSDTVTVRYTGAVPQAQDWVVINEIMYNALAADGDFVELHNRHPSFAFDLSGLELSGTAYTFPQGTFIPPNGYVVVAENTAAFAAAYGATIPVLGPYSGNLQNNGENVRLVKPASGADDEVVLDDVRYESALPWPLDAAGFGSSLQLIDAAQDNFRVGNWGATPANSAPLATPGRANSNRATLSAFPLVWINELVPHNLTGALDNQSEPEPWIELYNAGQSLVDVSGMFLSDDPENLTKFQLPIGTSIPAGQFLVIWADGETAESTPTALHTNFRLNPANGVVLLSRTQSSSVAATDYVRYVVSAPDQGYGSYPDGEPRRRRALYTLTPGGKNNPAIPALRVFINEWLASNSSVLRDPADQHFEDWFELHNAGAEAVDLSGFYLTDNSTRPTQFTIPPGTVIPPGGYRLFWADNEPIQNGPGFDVHVNFALSNDGEEIALFTPDEQLVDLVAFGTQTPNISQGRFPDGSEPPYLSFTVASPGEANISEFANQPPVISTIPDKEVVEGQTLTFTVQASDPDPNQTLAYSLLTAPESAAIDSSGKFSWTPAEGDGPGVYTMSVRVQDDGSPARAVTRSFRVTVAELNLPPVIGAIAPVTIDEGTLYSFEVPVDDPDLPGQILTFALEGEVPSGASIDSATGVFSWNPAESQGPGIFDFVVRVSDGATPPESVTAPFRITVREVNNAPIIVQVPPQAIDEGSLLSLNVEAVDGDNPPSALSYSIDSAPAGVSIDPATGQLTWRPSEADGPRDYSITVRVAESGGPSATMNFLVGVREVNTAPTMQAIANLVASPGQLITVTPVVNDADLPAQTLIYSSPTGLPPGAALDTTTGQFTWQLTDDPPAGIQSITIRVTDDAGAPLFVEQAFQIDVRAPHRVAINEIMHRPAAANAQFVELHNYSIANTANIGGWRLEGYDYVFPQGTTLQPGGFLCVARNLNAFRAAYGNDVAVVGPAISSLPADGGMLRLIKPAGPGLPDEVIDEIQFSVLAPWPVVAAQGASLQLLDPREDRRRVGNWGASAGSRTNAPVTIKTITGAWRYRESFPGATWRNVDFADGAWPSGNALFYVESAALPQAKSTPLTLGSTTYYFRTSFTFAGNPEGALLNLNLLLDDGAVIHLNGAEIARVGMPEGNIEDSTFAARTVGDATAYDTLTAVPATGLRVGENVIAVEVHQINAGSSDVVFGAAIDLVTLTAASFTPGAPNSVATDLNPFPNIWINEVLPNNTTGRQDNAGEREPWVELYNAGDAAVSLEGWYLTDSFAALTKWGFPNGASIPARGFMVIVADGEMGESLPAEQHTNFRLNATSGTVALVRSQNGTAAVVDYVNYVVNSANQSFGSQPDGAPYARAILPIPTPAQANQKLTPNAPQISLSLSEQGAVQLSWPTQAGFSYRVEARTAVHAGEWETLRETVGDGAVQSYSETPGPQSAARFYRISVE